MTRSIEGKWWGPDKIAHLLFTPAISGWIAAFAPAHALAAVVIAVLLSVIWEASNHYYVLDGERGMSALDLFWFLIGGAVSALLAYALQRGAVS